MVKRSFLLKNELKRDIAILKENYNPEKIILFGSLNSGKIKEWSDIDLIVIKDTKKPFLDRIREVLLLLKPNVGMDILVYTPLEFARIKERLFFKKEISGRGAVIYEKA